VRRQGGSVRFPRLLWAMVVLGRLQAQGELGHWQGARRGPAWRELAGGQNRRPRAAGAIEEMFRVPRDALFSTGWKRLLPDIVTIEPLFKLNAAAILPIVTPDGLSREIPLEPSPWAWSASPGPYGFNGTDAEYNPSNILNSQQGLECFFPVDELDSDAARIRLSPRRQDCPHFSGTIGDGRC
jgi:hypothetical protein